METRIDAVASALKTGGTLLRDVPLSGLTSFRIGGPAALVFRPDSAEGLCRALQACEETGLACHVLGNGTNVLAPDAGFSGLILKMDTASRPPVFDGCAVTAEAGTGMRALALFALDAGLMGLEAMAGIPGAVGGACAMNAGCYGAEIRQVLESVTIWRGGRVLTTRVAPDDLGLRTSKFAAPGTVVLRATFRLTPDDGTARERMRECSVKRREKQPLDYPSAGSVFKRPAGHFAGGLIEQCGLKGLRVGGAEVSTLHAGFIINRGGATERDVRTLIETVQSRVLQETGVRLEREVKLLSEV